MTRHTKYNLLAVLAFFCAMTTLGGLGNIAVHDPFYWFPFIVNVGVYAAIFYDLHNKGEEE